VCKKLKGFLSLKISLEEGVESREKEGVSRHHEEEEGGKKAKAKLCTVLSRHREFGWFGWEGGRTRNQGRGKDKESGKGSGLFPGPRDTRGFSEVGFGLGFFLRNGGERVAQGAEFEI